MQPLRLSHCRPAVATSNDDLSGIRDVDTLATWARRFIKIIAGILAAVFTWLQLKDFELAVVVERTTPELLRKATLVIYYLCWIGGASFDVSVQQKVYVADPARGRLDAKTYAIVIGFFAVALLLLWASDNERLLAPMLAIFVVANFFGWRHIVSRTRETVRASREKFGKDYLRQEELKLVDDYMTGKWQLTRFAFMLAIVLCANVVTFFQPVRQNLAFFLGHFSSAFTVENLPLLLPSFFIFSFVMIAESWIWLKRAIVAVCLSYAETLRTDYKLVRRTVKAGSGMTPS